MNYGALTTVKASIKVTLLGNHFCNVLKLLILSLEVPTIRDCWKMDVMKHHCAQVHNYRRPGRDPQTNGTRTVTFNYQKLRLK